MSLSKNYDKFNTFRNTYDSFIYKKHSFTLNKNSLEVKFTFTIDNEFTFQPKTIFKVSNISAAINTKQLDYLIFHLGMAELISYWKAICTKKVIIKPYQLDKKQIEWWKKLYFHGLGEFFYLNSIVANIETFIEIKSKSQNNAIPCNYSNKQQGTIVPVGGGKDSIVSLEFFKYLGEVVFPMLVNPRAAMTESVDTAEINSPFIIERTIDTKLLELNTQGFLNGHTPFSSILAFQSLILSYLTGIHNIALSNESSANEPTIANTKINHQYSKSYEFESDFRQYSKQYLLKDFNYYSVLRPLSELQIAYILSQFPQYFKIFKSCNVGSKNNIWCCSCSKCLFTAIMLHAFLHPNVLQQIFKTNMFDNPNLLAFFNQLTGIAEEKPFECVGTIDEVKIALKTAIDKYYKDASLPYLLDYYKKTELYKKSSPINIENLLFNTFDNKHFLSQFHYEKLKEFIQHFA